ncbi:MAG TPA: hypothetical protein VHB73_00530 [Alphaproteobacteria bacterium]|nr:hypothetical protein [Alphaproteobacteria bacterium]
MDENLNNATRPQENVASNETVEEPAVEVDKEHNEEIKRAQRMQRPEFKQEQKKAQQAAEPEPEDKPPPPSPE